MTSPGQSDTQPPLPRRFYGRHVVDVARDLLGRHLVRVATDGLMLGRIVEVEAYLADDDSANHAARGLTRRNAAMFGPPGHAYVYAIHSRWCLNAVTEPEGVPSAVLIRAVEPLAGLDLMRERRSARARLKSRATAKAASDSGTAVHDLARGPARLCEAFGIDRAFNGWDLTRGDQLWIAAAKCRPTHPAEIVTSPRIGVTSAHDLALRFFCPANPFVSRCRVR